jgi:hypothetical protein
VRQSGEGDRWRWYKFNASDEVLSEDDGTKCCQKMTSVGLVRILLS